MSARVVFRFWKVGPANVIALFPDIPSDAAGIYCNSYEHVGQHGDADYHRVIANTRPATPAEYAELKAELETLGYTDLKVCQRTDGGYRQRQEALKPEFPAYVGSDGREHAEF